MCDADNYIELIWFKKKLNIFVPHPDKCRKEKSMTECKHIVIADPSDAVRRGISAILSEPGLPSDVTVTEISAAEQLKTMPSVIRPNLLVICPLFAAAMSLDRIRKEIPDLAFVMLRTSLADTAAVAYGCWDEVISLYDPAEVIRARISRLIGRPDDTTKRNESLSRREKDIIACVVKGMTNRRVAEMLHLSPHTVATHRRNISSKLDIHSTPGLMIYAISNKLVRLDELELGD